MYHFTWHAPATEGFHRERSPIALGLIFFAAAAATFTRQAHAQLCSRATRLLRVSAARDERDAKETERKLSLPRQRISPHRLAHLPRGSSAGT
jgi:hypothetical protein